MESILCLNAKQLMNEDYSILNKPDTLYETEKRKHTSLSTMEGIIAESGCVFMNAIQKLGNSILEVAIIINELAIQPFRQELTSEH